MDSGASSRALSHRLTSGSAASDAELTTQQAADLLNVSRPFLIGLLQTGEVDFRMVGRQRRIKTASLTEYLTADDQQRLEAASELTQLTQETFHRLP